MADLAESNGDDVGDMFSAGSEQETALPNEPGDYVFRRREMKRYIIVIVSTLAVSSAIFRYSPALNSNPQSVQNKAEMKWKQDYINKIAPIMMRDPLLEMLGQTDSAIPYTYEEAVKLTGHSCLVVAAAWSMTRKALGELYPQGAVPVRGQITVQAPGAEDEWNIGVIGEVMTYITGAAPMSGFSGSAFGKGNVLAIRRNKLFYTEKPSKTAPPMMQWIFTRTDTGKKVAAKWNIKLVQPPLSEEIIAVPGKALAAGEFTPEEIAAFVRNWNDAARFVLQNADRLDGLVTVTPLE
jgi:hypothetical protein